MISQNWHQANKTKEKKTKALIPENLQWKSNKESCRSQIVSFLEVSLQKKFNSDQGNDMAWTEYL